MVICCEINMKVNRDTNFMYKGLNHQSYEKEVALDYMYF